MITGLEFEGNETHRLANKALVNVVLNLYIFSIRPHLSRRQTVLEAMAAHFLNQNRVCLGFSIIIIFSVCWICCIATMKLLFWYFNVDFRINQQRTKLDQARSNPTSCLTDKYSHGRGNSFSTQKRTGKGMLLVGILQEIFLVWRWWCDVISRRS